MLPENDQLRIIEIWPDGQRFEVEVTQSMLPLKVGRSPGPGGIIVGSHLPVNMAGRNLQLAISLVHCTIYEENGDLKVLDGGVDSEGNYRTSRNGIFVAGQRRTNPIEMRPASRVDIFPQFEGHWIRIEWEPATTGNDTGGTQGFDAFEKRQLKDQLIISEQTVERLEKSIGHFRAELNKIQKDLRTEKKTNAEQQSALSRQQDRTKKAFIFIAALGAFHLIFAFIGLGVQVSFLKDLVDLLDVVIAIILILIGIGAKQ